MEESRFLYVHEKKRRAKSKSVPKMFRRVQKQGTRLGSPSHAMQVTCGTGPAAAGIRCLLARAQLKPARFTSERLKFWLTPASLDQSPTARYPADFSCERDVCSFTLGRTSLRSWQLCLGSRCRLAEGSDFSRKLGNLLRESCIG